MMMNLRPLILFLLLLVPGLTRAEDAAPVPTQRVGQPLVIREIYIPGGEVKAKARRDRKPPLVVRIMEVKPAKDGQRYNFEVQGLDPGTYNLADFLEPVDESAQIAFPAIPLEITTPLAPGIVAPHDNAASPLPSLGGYRLTMILLGIVWVAGFVAILLWKKKKPVTTDGAGASGPSLGERLRPLVSAASKGDLPVEERARLERLVIGHWRDRLPDIAHLDPAQAMVKLRNHPEASPLILALERWLHAPASNTSPAEIESLLAPYAA